MCPERWGLRSTLLEFMLLDRTTELPNRAHLREREATGVGGEQQQDIGHVLPRQGRRVRTFEGRDPPLGGSTPGPGPEHVQQARDDRSASDGEVTRVMEGGCRLRDLREVGIA